MRTAILLRMLFVAGLVSLGLIRGTTQVAIAPDRADGIYRAGERVTWTIKRSGDRPMDSLRYALKPGGLHISEQGPVTLVDSTAEISYTFDTPGSVLLEVRWKGEEGNRFFNRAVGGAVADPEKLVLTAPCPADFDAFWEAKLKELEAVPVNARLVRDDSAAAGVESYEVTMDHFRGAQIWGQLARPAGGGKLPALLIVQWAGVYPLERSWVENRAREGWLVLNICAHDMPIHETQAYYGEQSAGALKDYWAIGNDDRETSYFLRMYLSCFRAAEYLTQRPDWNGETLVVTGDSQGGQQALMTAGLHPGITACVALVPAGFDMLGPEAGRRGGWPQWYDHTEGKDPVKVHEASRYFDVANFIPRITCPVLVGVGLLDETCPPEGILAGLNQLTGNREIMILPGSGHQNWNRAQEPFQIRREQVWFPALKEGKSISQNP